jgi:hypothetical protein
MSRQVKIIVGAVVGVVLVSVLVAVFVMGRQSSAPATESTSKDMVRIEIRSMPEMTVMKDGKKLGKTPLSFMVAKSTKPIDIDTEWTEQRIYRKGQRMIPRHAHKVVIPDDSKTVDFKARDADPVHEDPAATE